MSWKALCIRKWLCELAGMRVREKAKTKAVVVVCNAASAIGEKGNDWVPRYPE